jgi:hypothetical protein
MKIMCKIKRNNYRNRGIKNLVTCAQGKGKVDPVMKVYGRSKCKTPHILHLDAGWR